MYPEPMRLIVQNVIFVAAGYEVTGIDQSHDLLALARKAAPRAEFIQGSAHEIDLPPCGAMNQGGTPPPQASKARHSNPSPRNRLSNATCCSSSRHVTSTRYCAGP